MLVAVCQGANVGRDAACKGADKAAPQVVTALQHAHYTPAAAPAARYGEEGQARQRVSVCPLLWMRSDMALTERSPHDPHSTYSVAQFWGKGGQRVSVTGAVDTKWGRGCVWWHAHHAPAAAPAERCEFEGSGGKACQ